jgi:hypothetical protein
MASFESNERAPCIPSEAAATCAARCLDALDALLALRRGSFFGTFLVVEKASAGAVFPSVPWVLEGSPRRRLSVFGGRRNKDDWRAEAKRLRAEALTGAEGLAAAARSTNAAFSSVVVRVDEVMAWLRFGYEEEWVHRDCPLGVRNERFALAAFDMEMALAARASFFSGRELAGCRSAAAALGLGLPDGGWVELASNLDHSSSHERLARFNLVEAFPDRVRSFFLACPPDRSYFLRRVGGFVHLVRAEGFGRLRNERAVGAVSLVR